MNFIQRAKWAKIVFLGVVFCGYFSEVAMATSSTLEQERNQDISNIEGKAEVAEDRLSDADTHTTHRRLDVERAQRELEKLGDCDANNNTCSAAREKVEKAKSEYEKAKKDEEAVMKEVDNLQKVEKDIKSGEKKGSSEKAFDDASKEAEKAAELMKELVSGTDNFEMTYLNVGNESQLSLDLAEKDNNLIYRIIRLFTTILGTLGVLLLVISGMMMVASHGDEQLLTQGKQMFFYTTAGLAAGFLAYAAVQMVISFVFRLA